MRRAKRSILVFGLGALLVAAGCTVSGHARTGYSTTPRSDLELVQMRSGLWVAVDYHRPLFYADGYYWMWRDGTWLRSYSYYSGDWVVVHHSYVPGAIRHLDHHPRYYVRYEPRHSRPRYRATRARAERRGAAAPTRVRDHRSRDRGDGPKVRDHRRRGDDSKSRSRSRSRSRDDGPKTRDHRRGGDDSKSRSRSRSRSRDDGPKTRDHRKRGDDSKSRSRSRSRDRDDGPKVRDHRDSGRDKSRSRSRGRPR